MAKRCLFKIIFVSLSSFSVLIIQNFREYLYGLEYFKENLCKKIQFALLWKIKKNCSHDHNCELCLDSSGKKKDITGSAANFDSASFPVKIKTRHAENNSLHEFYVVTRSRSWAKYQLSRIAGVAKCIVRVLVFHHCSQAGFNPFPVPSVGRVCCWFSPYSEDFSQDSPFFFLAPQKPTSRIG